MNRISSWSGTAKANGTRKIFSPAGKTPISPPLGIEEARRAGRELKKLDILFSVGFTSSLIRAQHTLDLIFEELGQTAVPTIKDRALNERHYGDLSGLNKDEAREQMGRRAGAPVAALL